VTLYWFTDPSNSAGKIKGGRKEQVVACSCGIDFESFREVSKSLVVVGPRFEPETFLIPSSDRLVVL
jgi:hypothetical protein